MSSVDEPDSPSDAALGSAAADGSTPSEPWLLWLETGAEATAEAAAAACAALIVPSICVCCGGASSQARSLSLDPTNKSTTSPSMLLPLCDRCYTHDAEERTHSLSLAVAGLLLGTSLALGLPLALERLAEGGARQISAVSWLSRYGIFLIPGGVILGLMIARVVAYAWARRRRQRAFQEAGSTGCVAPPALSLRSEGSSGTDKTSRKYGLLCRNPRFASGLLAANPGRVSVGGGESTIGPSPLAGSGGLPQPELRWLLAVFGVVGLISAASFWIHRPELQVLNLTGAPLVLEVDGERVGSVGPTSQESPRAGLSLRLPAGRRRVRALQGELVVAEADLTLLAMARHLYAPASQGHCFWLERLGYGRGNLTTGDAAAPRVERLPLTSPLGFWAFDGAVDVWLAPPPEPLLEDARSSGGEVVALRQARCSDAPADAKPR